MCLPIFYHIVKLLGACISNNAFKVVCNHFVSTFIFVEVIVDTISRLGVIHRKLKLPQLWSEVTIIKALVYKHSNQHRKEKYFQGLKKVKYKWVILI